MCVGVCVCDRVHHCMCVGVCVCGCDVVGTVHELSIFCFVLGGQHMSVL